MKRGRASPSRSTRRDGLANGKAAVPWVKRLACSWGLKRVSLGHRSKLWPVSHHAGCALKPLMRRSTPLGIFRWNLVAQTPRPSYCSPCIGSSRVPSARLVPAGSITSINWCFHSGTHQCHCLQITTLHNASTFKPKYVETASQLWSPFEPGLSHNVAQQNRNRLESKHHKNDQHEDERDDFKLQHAVGVE